MSYVNAAILQFPSNYVLMSEEEITYVDGGYSFLNDENYSDVRTDVIRISAAHFNQVASLYNTTAGAVAVATAFLAQYGLPISAFASGVAAGICAIVAGIYSYIGSTYRELKVTVKSRGHYTTSSRTALGYSYQYIK